MPTPNTATSPEPAVVHIQIYGITSPDDAALAARLGVDHVGVTIDETRTLPDAVTPAEAAEILAVLPPGVTKVALTMSADRDEIVRVATEVDADVLHVGADPAACGDGDLAWVRARLPGLQLMRAVPVVDESSIELARAFAGVADRLLLDTMAPAGQFGATGAVHDWSISARIVEAVPVPVFLAGGLSAANVADAVRRVRPWGVDSFTHTCVPGDLRRKDPDRLGAFVTAVRSA